MIPMTERTPLVSAVMVTRNRARYLPTALYGFFQQTYPNLELVVIDDGDDDTENIIAAFRAQSGLPVFYHRVSGTVGFKRNEGARLAHGEIIASWDDDDWSAPHRIETQVEQLLTSEKSVTGYNETIRYDEATGKFYRNPPAYPYHVSGTSQCYKKAWWARHPFPDASLGEDMAFSRVAMIADQLLTVPLNRMIVARKHSTNTSEVDVKYLDEIFTNEVPKCFFNALMVPAILEKHSCTSACPRGGGLPFHTDGARILVAIESCHRDRDNGAQQAQRDTWVKDLNEYRIDHKFFVGRPTFRPFQDEVALDVDDSYMHLSHKTKAMCRWALDRGYDSLFKADTDTIVSVRNLVMSRFEEADYMGSENSDTTPPGYRMRTGCYPGKITQFASGGAGYWLSKKAMKAVVDSKDERLAGSAEDVFVAIACLSAGITPQWNGHMQWRPGSVWDDLTISFHLSSALQKSFNPKMMYEYYAKG